jgi:acyl-coenzyme A synthetase/AMP-(fatty) acid ligase
MQALRLLSVDSRDSVIACYRGAAVSAERFVAQAESLARALPSASYIINLAENRYHFLLGWAAACLRQQVTLLPSAQTEDVLAGLRRAHAHHHTVDDALIERLADGGADTATSGAGGWPPEEWSLPADRVVAIAFTSGSTGEPQPHPKSWGSLFHNSRLAAAEVVGDEAQSVVATVPAQHMYGLEASLLGALTAGHLVHDGKPFFPADVRAALQAMPAPRTLVTAPAHLRVLTDAAIELPALDRVVSATAPLSPELARQVEQRWGTQVVEIYGCTEAGVMAHRRTTRTDCWRTFRDCSMAAVADAAEYRAPHLAAPIALPDCIEAKSATEFLLRGRSADMIKVAGKRASLQELTRQVLAVPGVEDAVVFVPREDARPAAAVVAPGMTVAAILGVLRNRMDGVFVPRPLLIVERLPRNAVGKLPREALLRLLDAPA